VNWFSRALFSINCRKNAITVKNLNVLRPVFSKCLNDERRGSLCGQSRGEKSRGAAFSRGEWRLASPLLQESASVGHNNWRIFVSSHIEIQKKPAEDQSPNKDRAKLTLAPFANSVSIVTDEELKELVASLAVAQKETDRQLKETDRQLKETDGQLKDTDRQLRDTDQQLKDTHREVEEAARVIRENGRQFEEYKRENIRQFEEYRRSEAEASRELRRQIGGLGNKFGDFAEGMAIPSLIEILAKRFGAEQIIETRRMRKGDEEIELDLIGAANGENKIVVAAEVKSVLNQRELDKFIRNLQRFFEFFPQFKGYKLYGVLAAVESSNELDTAALAQGIAVARMHGDIFRLKESPRFQPRDFSEKTN
jgi:hypothetical protein